MIELHWNTVKEKNLLQYAEPPEVTLSFVAKLFAWLTSQLVEEKIPLDGWILARDEKRLDILIMIHDVLQQQKVLKILLEPPGEFKERYTACILSAEPVSVVEKSSDEEEEESSSSDEDVAFPPAATAAAEET